MTERSDQRIKIECYKWFKGGRISDSRNGKLSTTTPDNIKLMRLAVEEDQRLSMREVESDLGIPKPKV